MTNLKPRIAHKEEVGKLLKPIVVGGDILAYSYVRELNRAFGIEQTIVLAAADIKMLSTSRFTDYRLIPDVHDAEVLYATLEGIAAEFARENPDIVPMVFGCDDCHARMLSEAKLRLEAAGIVVPYIDFDLLDDITQKRRFYELCEELDIPYPKTWYFDCSDAGPDELPLDELPFPLIAKPSNSAQFQDAEPTVRGWRKIYEIEDAAEMAEVWKSLRESSYNNLMVLQDFIPGSDDAIRTLTTFSNAEGEVRCVSGGVVCLQDHDPTAIGNPLCILGEREDAIVECAKRFVKRVGYCGMANFDIKLDERDGSFRFFEVNTRCGRNTYYMSLGGQNFVELMVRQFVLGEDIPYHEAYDPFVYCCVPAYVLKRSMENESRLAEALGRLRSNKESYPLHYAPDTASHNLWAKIMFMNQIRKFKKFYWDTKGKQLK